ncbi:MAG: glycosyltransferase family 2 protein [Candidatus Omnitrophota bacterium]
MSRETITALIIAKNEEKNILGCLENIKWCDEIVVVDDMSSDNTAEICRNFGAKVFKNKSDGDYNLQCDIGLRNVTSDWVLNIDVDERVSFRLKKDILGVLASNSKFSAYSFMRRNHFLGKFMRHGGWYERQVKFFRTGRGRYPERRNLGLLRVEGDVGALDSHINHYPFVSISQFINRQINYAIFEAKVMREERGVIGLDEIKYNLTTRPLKLFFKLYFKKQGFRDGMHGFIFSILNAWRHYTRWSLYWNRYCMKGDKTHE